MEFATLKEVKSYLSIPEAFTNHDGKLSIVLGGVNSQLSEDTVCTTTDSVMRAAACMLCEYRFSKTTGVSAEGDSDYKKSFEKSTDSYPPDVMSLIKDRLTEEAIKKYSKKSKINFGVVQSF